MSSFFARPRDSQPQQAARINPALLDYKPTLLWLAPNPTHNGASGVAGSRHYGSGDITLSATAQGLARSSSGASCFSFTNTQAIGNSDVTVLMYAAPAAAAFIRTALYQVGSAGSMWFGANINELQGPSNGTLCLGLLQPGVNRSSIKVADAIDGTLSGYLIRKSGSAGAAWKNGVPQTVTTTGTLTGSPSASGDSVDILGNNVSGSYAFVDPALAVVVFQSALPDDMCRELSRIESGWRLLSEPEPVRIYWPGVGGGGGSDTSISPTPGSLIGTGLQPSVTEQRFLTPSVGALTLVGYAASLGQSLGIVPGAGALTIQGYAAAVTTGDNRLITPTTGDLSAAGYAATLALSDNRNISPAAGALELLGYAPSLLRGTVILPGGGQLTLAGYAPQAGTAGAISPSNGTLTLVGYQPTLREQSFIIPGVGQLTVTGVAPSVAGAGTLIPSEANLTLVGYQPGVTQQLFTIPGVGTISVEGQQPLIPQDVYIVPGVGAATFLGYAPTVGLGRVVTPAVGEMFLAGGIPSVTTAAVDSGSQSITPLAGSLGFLGYAPSALSAVFVTGNGRVFWLPARSTEFILPARSTRWVLR
jgi:hypothetical protein